MPIDIGGYVSGGIGSALGIAKVIGISVFFIILIVVGSYFLLHYLKYDITVLVLSQRTGVLKGFLDKGAIFNNKLKLLKARKDVKAPEYKYLLPAKNGNLLILYQATETDYVPLSPQIMNLVKIKGTDEGGELPLKLIPSELKLFATLKMKEARDKYSEQSLLEKYLPYAIWALVVLGTLLVIWTLMQGLSDLGPALNNIATALRETAKATRGVAPY